MYETSFDTPLRIKGAIVEAIRDAKPPTCRFLRLTFKLDDFLAKTRSCFLNFFSLRNFDALSLSAPRNIFEHASASAFIRELSALCIICRTIWGLAFVKISKASLCLRRRSILRERSPLGLGLRDSPFGSPPSRLGPFWFRPVISW